MLRRGKVAAIYSDKSFFSLKTRIHSFELQMSVTLNQNMFPTGFETNHECAGPISSKERGVQHGDRKKIFLIC
jgi:hypothetical protein